MYFNKLQGQACELITSIFGHWLRYLKHDLTKPWFASAPLGENKHGTMVKVMFAEVGITGKTNHN